MNERTIFLEALEKTNSDEQQAFLDDACSSDAELRAKVEELLQAHQQADSFLESPPGNLGQTIDSASTSEPSKSAVAPTMDSKEGSGDNLPMPAVGEKLRYFGDYELLEEIARGGMGVVYKARQVSLNRTVALKMILSSALASQAEVERFHVEAQAAGNLDHPNLVPIYEVGEHERQHYFSMKLVEGGTLGDLTPKLSSDPKVAARLMRTIARAVHAAHQSGILHRDLKPGNILIDDAGQPHVTDFGLAKQVDSDSGLTQTGQIMGTPNYMAPEQARGQTRSLTTATDIYSLGAILFETLTGHPPFQNESVVETLRQVTDAEPPRPRTINTSIDRDLETIVLKCLDKDPRRRYGSAEALADDLDRWLCGEPILARPIGKAERAAKWVKRHPAVSALVTLVVVAMVGGTIVSAYFAVQANLAADAERAARRDAEVNESRAVELADSEREAREEQQRLTKLAETKSRESERLLFGARINLAQTAWRGHQARKMRELLSIYTEPSSSEDLRGWEWGFLWRQCHQELAVFPGTTNTVAFSPDGKYLATAHPAEFNPGGGRSDGPADIHVWDLATNKRHRTLKGYTHWGVKELTFTDDGERLVSVGFDRSVRIHSLADGKVQAIHEQATIKFGGMGVQVALSPGGKYMASCAGKVEVWELDETRVLHTFKYDDAYDIAAPTFSGDGRRLAYRSPNSIHVCDLDTGEEIRRIRVEQHLGHTCALSHDGKLVAGARAPGVIFIWEVESGRLVKSIQGGGGGLTFTPDGRHILSTHSGGIVRIWRVADGTLAGVFSGQRRIGEIAVSSDGSTFATAGTDNRGDDTRVWSLAAGVAYHTLHPPEDQPRNCVFGANSQQLFVATSHLHLIELSSGRVLWKQEKPHKGRTVTALCVDRRRGRCASAGFDSRIVIWDLETGEQQRELADRYVNAHSMDFSPDGRLLVSTGKDSWGFVTEMALWDVASGEKVLTWNQPTRRPREDMTPAEMEAFASDMRIKTSQSICFSPDGKQIVSGHDDGCVRFWNLEGELLSTLDGHTAPVASIAFSSDGSLLASGSLDQTICIRDEQRRVIHVMRGHTNQLLSVEFSPDGRRLLSRGFNDVVKIWDVQSGQELLSLEAVPAGVNKYHQSGWRASFSPDGKLIAAAGDGIRLWSAYPIKPYNGSAP